LILKISTLSEWDKLFDERMTPLILPDDRGKSSKISVEMVKKIVEIATDMQDKGQRLRLKAFTKRLSTEQAITISSKKVAEVLIANDLYRVNIRIRRPGFYQSMKQAIPNGLLRIDSKIKSHYL
jgi:hypothetical protein